MAEKLETEGEAAEHREVVGGAGEADIQAAVELDVTAESVGDTAVECRGVFATTREMRELEEAFSDGETSAP